LPNIFLHATANRIDLLPKCYPFVVAAALL